MTVSLGTARANVRSLIDETNSQFWTNLELDNWINEGCYDAARRGEWKRAKASIVVTANTQTYTAPVDVYRIYRIEFVPTASDVTYTLEFRGYMEMDQVWGINQQWPASYPLYYTLWKVPPAMNIIVYPVPAQAGNFFVYYYQTVTTALVDGDAIDMLQGWEDMIYDFAAYRALRKDADPRWKEFKDTYEDKMTMFITSTRQFQDQAGTFSTGQAALPEWLISDGLY
jgi:hypothetical protein